LKRHYSNLNKISLLLVFALLASMLTLPVGFVSATAQSDKEGKANKKQKSFGHKRETVSIKPSGKSTSLSGANKGKPADIAVDFLKQNRQKLGLAESDVTQLKEKDKYTSQHNGVTHIYLRQEIAGLEVLDSDLGINVAKDGSVINLHSSFVKDLQAAVNSNSPSLSPAQAVEAVVSHLELTLTEPLAVIETQEGAQRETIFSTGGVASEPIRARLAYQPVDDSNVRLVWNVELAEASGEHWWSISVDAANASILAGDDYVDHDNWTGAVPDVERNRNLQPRSATASASLVASTASRASLAAAAVAAPTNVIDGSTYNVFAFPFENPNDGARTLVTNPADAFASPFGWHDTNGAPGAEFTVTRGNNVHAYTDVDNNNNVDPGSDPSGGANLQFDFPFDQTQAAPASRNAAVTNLFYWNNIVHDVFYQYGFDEASGNFQVNNYGRGPVVNNVAVGGNDDVRAEAQDGSGTNNANFFTPVDGQRPRMQMFVWTYPFIRAVVVNPPSAIAGNYPATGANFGPAVTNTGLTGDVALVNDGAGVSSTDACEPLVGFPAGKIALLDRGSCDFVVKVKNAQNAGAIGAIVASNAPGDPVTMGGTDATIVIPAIMVTQASGNLYKANLPFNATLQVNQNPEPSRDSDFDAAIIGHEYGHGISNRLTGGRTVVNCLNNQEQMGEGWSDFMGLVLTTSPADTPTTQRSIGSYVSFQPATGRGIRPTPYTTDMSVNPTTYGQIGGLAIPHGVGYAWASMLWEMYWNLVEVHGYNPNVYAPWNTGGNNLAIQLVIDGMKLQPCRPGFVQGRDAIIQADQQLTGGANACLIWKAFAKRGLGASANQGSNLSSTDGTQAFDLPATCQAQIDAAPPSMTETLKPLSQSTQTLTITNNSTTHGTDLNWTITEAPSSCDAPADVQWVSVAPQNGTTAPQSSSDVAVTFDSTGLSVSQFTAKLCINSNDGDTPTIEIPLTLNSIYDFTGFFSPIANAPASNDTAAGSTVPVKFNLGNNYGPDIFAAGFPASRQIDCNTKAPLGALEPTEAPGNSSLRHDISVGGYSFNWKTDKSYAGTCRELVVQLNDGTPHSAFFNFRK
jgi:hypothetical protein